MNIINAKRVRRMNMRLTRERGFNESQKSKCALEM